MSTQDMRQTLCPSTQVMREAVALVHTDSLVLWSSIVQLPAPVRSISRIGHCGQGARFPQKAS